MQVVKGLWSFSIWERNCQCFKGVFLCLMQFLKGFMKVFNVWGKGLWRFSIWERNCQCFEVFSYVWGKGLWRFEARVYEGFQRLRQGFMKVFNVWGKGLWRFSMFEARVYEDFKCLRQGFMKVFNVWGRFSLIQRITKSGVQKLEISVIFSWMVVACFKELLSTSNSLIANVCVAFCCFNNGDEFRNITLH